MSATTAEEKPKGRFEPKVPVQLNPPIDREIPTSELSRCNSVDDKRCYVAIKGKVFDVTGNKVYEKGGSYHAFAGKDASRALAMTSTKAEDVSHVWEDLDDKQKQTLADWETFFSKRYNVMGWTSAGAKEEETSAKKEEASIL